MVGITISISGGIGAKPSREDKGKSLLAPFDDYVSIDIETTGLDSNFDNIIELAAVRVVSGEIDETFQTLVNPEQSLDEFIVELTGITDDMLEDAPLIEEVLPDFIDFIGDSVIVAHNANFDINFIYDECSNNNLPPLKNDFVDTMRMSRRLFSEHSHHRLSDLMERFGIFSDVSHRALEDAEVVYECYEYMKQYIEEKGIDYSSLIRKKNYQVKAKDITSNNEEYNEDSPIYGKVFVFTGTLEKMVRKDAMQLVVDNGGQLGDSVTKSTDYLVLGNLDYSAKQIKGGKSRKQKKAEELSLKGCSIETISENVFYDMLEETVNG